MSEGIVGLALREVNGTDILRVVEKIRVARSGIRWGTNADAYICQPVKGSLKIISGPGLENYCLVDITEFNDAVFSRSGKKD